MAQIWIFVQVFKVRAVLSLEPSTGLEKGVFAGCWGFFLCFSFLYGKGTQENKKITTPLSGELLFRFQCVYILTFFFLNSLFSLLPKLCHEIESVLSLPQSSCFSRQPCKSRCLEDALGNPRPSLLWKSLPFPGFISRSDFSHCETQNSRIEQ